MTNPQCARCGEFEMVGTVHLCADVMSALASTDRELSVRRAVIEKLKEQQWGVVAAGLCQWCARPRVVCDADVLRGCGSTQAGSTPVSLPNKTEQDTALVEETRDDGLPPPSGYMSRPKLL